MRNLFLAGAAALVAALCACSGTTRTQAGAAADAVNDATTPLHLLQPEYPVPYGELTAGQVKANLDRVFGYIDSERPAAAPVDADGAEVTDTRRLAPLEEGLTLQRGAFRIGSYEWGITYQALMAAADATGDTRYEAYVDHCLGLLAAAYPLFLQRDAARPEVADAQMEQVIHPRALDDCGTMCTAFMEWNARRAARTAAPTAEGPLAEAAAGMPGGADSIVAGYLRFVRHGQHRLPDGLFARHRPQRNTVWLDDMFMGIPTLAHAAAYLHDDALLDEAAAMYRGFVERMWVPERRLYRHGYVEGLAQQPTYHWARANGWALLTTVELLDVLPEGHPERPFVENQLRQHVAGLAAVQAGEGFWHQLLDREDSYLETSATAIFCYSIAHSIRRGWLEGVTYGGVAQLAWHAVASRISPEGRVEGTCVGTGMAFDPAFYYYRPVSAAAAHGYGPAIWAAAEMIALLGEWHPRTNDSGLHFYEQEQTNPAPLFYLTEDGTGEAVK